ncbi:hypothetical protein WDW86_05370, partial [Bdellovibrionota bacterium FG-2]
GKVVANELTAAIAQADAAVSSFATTFPRHWWRSCRFFPSRTVKGIVASGEKVAREARNARSGNHCSYLGLKWSTKA